MIDFQLIDDASISADRLLESGTPFKKMWRLFNSGNEVWESCLLVNCGGTVTADLASHPLPAVKAGETGTVTLKLTAPSTVGSQSSCWRFQDATGAPVGDPLIVSFKTTPGGSLNGRMVSYHIDSPSVENTVESGRPFTLSVLLENSGGTSWRPGDHLYFLGGDGQPQFKHVPLPAVIPGDRVDITLELTAGPAAGSATTFWQLRTAAGTPFGGVVAPTYKIAPQPIIPEPAAVDPQKWRQVIWDITGVFESGRVGGDPAALQTHDAGIVSFGKHQATLQSGNLAVLLNLYIKNSSSAAAQALQAHYLHRVQQRDPNLRHDTEFHNLLRQAGSEPAMQAAQDDLFATHFYNPAVTKAAEIGLQTPLGLACLYDTRIQHGTGGANFLIGLTSENFSPPPAASTIDEAAWLHAFLNEREALLNRLADKREAEAAQTADPQRKRSLQLTARALRISTFRAQELQQLLNSGNLQLKGNFRVRGLQIQGL
ncbi:MAG: NBR1-Ig-like domain-containing protein [Ardenticatenaceae bacterium]|nr:NBR1-Ig-like domain-containing protein [Ardenticatenaceae bacterium]